MPLTWIALLVVGSVLGWLTAVITRQERPREILVLMALGVAGGLLAAVTLTPLLAGRIEVDGFSLPGLLLSLLGSFVLLGVATLVLRRQLRRR